MLVQMGHRNSRSVQSYCWEDLSGMSFCAGRFLDKVAFAGHLLVENFCWTPSEQDFFRNRMLFPFGMINKIAMAPFILSNVGWTSDSWQSWGS